MTQVAEVENAIARMADRMRQSQQLETIYRTTLAELRQLFKCDRLAIYRFNSDWSGEFIAESVASDWVPLVETISRPYGKTNIYSKPRADAIATMKP